MSEPNYLALKVMIRRSQAGRASYSRKMMADLIVSAHTRGDITDHEREQLFDTLKEWKD